MTLPIDWPSLYDYQKIIFYLLCDMELPAGMEFSTGFEPIRSLLVPIEWIFVDLSEKPL